MFLLLFFRSCPPTHAYDECLTAPTAASRELCVLSHSSIPAVLLISDRTSPTCLELQDSDAFCGSAGWTSLLAYNWSCFPPSPNPNQPKALVFWLLHPPFHPLPHCYQIYFPKEQLCSNHIPAQNIFHRSSLYAHAWPPQILVHGKSNWTTSCECLFFSFFCYLLYALKGSIKMNSSTNKPTLILAFCN